MTQAGFQEPTPARHMNHSHSSMPEYDYDSDSDPSYQPPPSARDPPPPPRRSSSRGSAAAMRFNRNRSMSSHSSDAVFRNVCIVAVALTISLLFLHLLLYVGIIFVGILTPAWQTFKSLENRHQTVVVEIDDDDDDTSEVISATPEVSNWQAYWVIASILFASDQLLSSFLFRVTFSKPLYHSFLFCLVTWLTRRSGANAKLVYDVYIRQWLLKYEGGIDHAIDKIVAKLDAITRKSAGALYNAVEPYARQLEAVANGAYPNAQLYNNHLHR